MSHDTCLSPRASLGAIVPNAGPPSAPAQLIAHPSPLPGLQLGVGAMWRTDAAARP